MSTSKLFQPIQVGDITLSHRVVLSPLSRFRGDTAHVPGPLVKEYYSQRGSFQGTLLVTEGTFVSPQAAGFPNAPGIWSDAQIAAWKEVTDAVHSKGSYIFLQLWALGRASLHDFLEKEGPYPYVSASPIKLSTKDVAPRAATVEEIKEYVQWYATGASNAVHKAGFDGVEIHAANGYLIDQFIQDVSNHRTDEYGGSIENRTRLPLEIVEAVTRAVGENKTAIRLSPWGRPLDMGMDDPKPTFTYLVSRIRDLYPNFAYVHLIEPRVDGHATREEGPREGESNDFIRDIWAPRPLITAGGYTRELGMQVADEKGDLIAYGRNFIANPDLPLRLKYDLPLNVGDRPTYYQPSDPPSRGYTDYPFASFTPPPLPAPTKSWFGPLPSISILLWSSKGLVNFITRLRERGH